MGGCFNRSKEDEDEKVRKEANKKIERQLQRDKQLYRATHRLLLLGKIHDILSGNMSVSATVTSSAIMDFYEDIYF